MFMFKRLQLTSCRLKGLPKLSDANNAGTRNASNCTLILTEGDSAKSLAVAGLSVIGRDNYGVFPLRGKLLNVREAKHDQIMKNEEIQNIKKILGLQHNKDYRDTKDLRYGQLMIMTDQVSLTYPALRERTDISLGSRWFAYQRFNTELSRPLLSLSAQNP